MDLVEIQVSEPNASQLVILQEKEGDRNFPIFIGPVEAALLEAAVKGAKAPRPLAHDLTLNVVQALGARLTGIVVDELSHNTYFAKLLIKSTDGNIERVDSRPSDALIIAVKEQVPIYVEESVLVETASDDEDDDNQTQDESDEEDQDDES